MEYSFLAFILLGEPSGENDEIFTFFSQEFGLFQAKAKSSKKINSKLKMALEDFSFVKVTLAPTWKGGAPTIIGCERLKSFEGIKKSFIKIFLTMYLSELLLKAIIKKEKNDFAFKLFSGAIKKINETPETKLKSQYNNFIYFFIIKLLKESGMAPQTKKCLACQKKKNLAYFDILRGGTLCNQCGQKDKKLIRVKSDILKIIDDLENEKWNFVSNLRLGNFQNFILSKILVNFFETHFNQKLFSPFLIPKIV
jgi:DNA repair protein RecO (recombination protein O)